ncbi:invertebrate-type lysozyme 3 [Agrilus planipennis]|uniref:lysozyme n=1 Tax=Agrilus planipennis TaxID=224129 RepID=A0A1W4X8R4_AGRPL|nr:invertebrate-type lysozyme 3 [Agrilus planipennis]
MSRFLVISAVFTFYVTVSLVKAQRGDLPVNQACLGCLCEAISGCDLNKKCSGDVCGPFQMTWPYWADGGKPTINKESPDSPTAYANCANDPYCAALAVQGYMSKYQQDCNGDGKIDCDDFAAIHKIGGYGCRGVVLPDPYNSRYQQCKKIVGGATQG